MIASRATNSSTFKVSTPSDREIRITRLFNAPRQLVFDAFTKPEHVRRWWGILDEGYSVPVCDVDLRVGGAWRYVSRSPHGEVAFYGEYREISPPERVVFTENMEPYPVTPETESVVVTELTEEDGKTRFTLTATYPSVEVRDMVINSGMESGAAVSYDRLEDLVEELHRSNH